MKANKKVWPWAVCASVLAAFLFNRQASDAISILPVAIPSGDAVELHWDIGRLQQADEVIGPWQDVEQAESPFIYEPGGAQRFFRLKLN